jgi:hypothetical protein
MGFAFLVRAGDDSPPVSERLGKRHKTVGMWAHQAISLVHRWLPDRDIKLMGDTAYSVLELGLHAKAQQVALITTGRLDAVLHEPPPERTQRTIGRRRVKGLRLPTLEQVLQNPATAWQKLTVNWHGKARANPGNGHQHGPVVPLWIQSLTHRASVLTRDPLGKRPPKAIFSTDPSLTAEEIITDAHETLEPGSDL